MVHGVAKIYGKERRRILAKSGLLRCDRCPYHRVENAKRVPKSDKHKLVKRETIRKGDELCQHLPEC